MKYIQFILILCMFISLIGFAAAYAPHVAIPRQHITILPRIVGPATTLHDGFIPCDAVLNESVNLTDDLICTGGNGLTLVAEGITLDCQGHHIANTVPVGVPAITILNNSITVKNCLISNNGSDSNYGWGILAYGGNNTFLNNDISAFTGMDIHGGHNNILYNTFRNISYSLASGIYIYDDYNNITNNTISNIPLGLVIFYSNYNDIANNIFIDLSDNPLEFYDQGIVIAGSNGSMIHANNISGFASGIYLQWQCLNNTIYNNAFSNIINAVDDGINNWNISKTPGTNIIGGPYIAGNYWSDYNGTDNDYDGIGDTNIPYNSSNNITNGGDYLPLKVLSVSNIRCSYSAGWNMVSVPLIVQDYNTTSLFPGAASNAYGYQSGYAVANSLRNMVGYWIKYANPVNVTFTGTIIQNPVINVSSGWNMIGAASTPVNVSSIISFPLNIVNSQYYGYTSAGYNATSVLNPCYGYWVKVNQSGILMLNGGIFPPHSSPDLSGFNTIKIADKTGSRTIYYGTSGKSISQGDLELPPKQSSLDVRFSNQAYAQVLPSKISKPIEYNIVISNQINPLSLEWIITQSDYPSTISYVSNGKTITQKLSKNGAITINDPNVNIIKLTINPLIGISSQT